MTLGLPVGIQGFFVPILAVLPFPFAPPLRAHSVNHMRSNAFVSTFFSTSYTGALLYIINLDVISSMLAREWINKYLILSYLTRRDGR